MTRSTLRLSLLFAFLAGAFVLYDLIVDHATGSEFLLDVPHIAFSLFAMLTSFIALSRALTTRDRAQAVLRQARDELEDRVRLRTAEVEHANAALVAEIGDRKRAEEAVRASEEMFATVFHSSPDAICVVTLTRGVFVDVNEAFTRLLGYQRSEVTGRTWVDLGLIPNVAGRRDLVALFREHGALADHQLEFVTRDGGLANVLLSLASITVGGEPCVLAIAHDITRRARTEAALRQAQTELARRSLEQTTLKERQRLARELHDSVSQALYGISLGANSVMRFFDKDRAAALKTLNYVLELTHSALVEMRALIFELRPESLEMEGLVVALTKHAEALRIRHGFEVELSLCDEPAAPLGIKEALYRIALEALQNTVKHARPGRLGIRLTWSLPPVSESLTGGLVLEVQDDGAGFTPQPAYPGHLGISSMCERADEVGGKLEIISAPGSGTLVRVTVPTAPAAPREPAQAEIAPAAA